MSWASSINTENCFERYAFDQSFAPSLRRTLERSSSSTAISSNTTTIPPRSHSTSPAPLKRSFFRSSKQEKSNPILRSHNSISLPVLISSTNPLVVAKNRQSTSLDNLEKHSPEPSVSVSEIIAHYLDEDEDEDEDEEEEVYQTEEEILTTRLSPPPFITNRRQSRAPSTTVSEEAFLPPQYQIHYPQPRSHFSDWSISSAEDTFSASTDSTFSRRESVASSCSDSSSASSIFSRRESLVSIFSDSTSISDAFSWHESFASISPESTSETSRANSFEYNPYISKVVTRGFKISDEFTLRQLNSASLDGYI